jgi:hypothetical protein
MGAKPPFFLRKCICNKNEITSFAVMRLFFHKVSVIFNTLLPMLSKTLYTSAVKFPASTSELITQTLFQFAAICKMASMQCIPYRAKQAVVGRCQIWAVSGMGKNSPSHFRDCPTYAQAGGRPGIAVKEKDVFHVSVRTNCTDAYSHAKVYSVLLNAGKNVSKMAETLWKNSLTPKHVWIIQANFIITATTF